MARRASSVPNYTVIIIIVAVIAVAFFGYKYIATGTKVQMTGAAKLNIPEYCENGNSFRGNEYIVEGTVDQRWPRDNGQVVSMLDLEKDTLVAIEVPAEFNKLNIERDQKLAIKVLVREGGILVAKDIKRL